MRTILKLLPVVLLVAAGCGKASDKSGAKVDEKSKKEAPTAKADFKKLKLDLGKGWKGKPSDFIAEWEFSNDEEGLTLTVEPLPSNRPATLEEHAKYLEKRADLGAYRWEKTKSKGTLPDGFFLIGETALDTPNKIMHRGFVVVRDFGGQKVHFYCPARLTEDRAKELVEKCKAASFDN
jgi:hypothetical protein